MPTCMSANPNECNQKFVNRPPCRQWQYNDKVDEYYVVTEDSTLHKKADQLRDIEETDLGESWLSHFRSTPVYIWKAFGCFIMQDNFIVIPIWDPIFRKIFLGSWFKFHAYT